MNNDFHAKQIDLMENSDITMNLIRKDPTKY